MVEHATGLIQIRQMGGVANGVGMYIPGAAKFKLGEELLVFLEKIKKTKLLIKVIIFLRDLFFLNLNNRFLLIDPM